jgi:hypothetical protein
MAAKKKRTAPVPPSSVCPAETELVPAETHDETSFLDDLQASLDSLDGAEAQDLSFPLLKVYAKIVRLKNRRVPPRSLIKHRRLLQILVSHCDKILDLHAAHAADVEIPGQCIQAHASTVFHASYILGQVVQMTFDEADKKSPMRQLGMSFLKDMLRLKLQTKLLHVICRLMMSREPAAKFCAELRPAIQVTRIRLVNLRLICLPPTPPPTPPPISPPILLHPLLCIIGCVMDRHQPFKNLAGN